MRDYLLAAAGTLLVIAGCEGVGVGVAPRPAEPPPADEAEVAPNDMCHVCHIPYAEEPLAVVHDKAKIWCIECHGLSAEHMQDENIGATPADIAYKKHQVDPMCSKCHKPKKHPKVTEKVRTKRLAESKKAQEKIKGRQVEVTGVCTDCHGSHWIPPIE